LYIYSFILRGLFNGACPSSYFVKLIFVGVPTTVDSKLNAKKTFPHKGKGKETIPSFGGREESRAL